MVKYKSLDRTFSALSDATRRSILVRLRRGEATVNELAEPFGMSLPAVSKHIKVLEAAKLVERTRNGRQFLIRLSPQPLSEAEKWIASNRIFWEQSLDRLADYVKQNESQKPRRSNRRKKRKKS